jgi:DNA-binding transcriptional regulator YdaS (Cro superfamily)
VKGGAGNKYTWSINFKVTAEEDPEIAAVARTLPGEGQRNGAFNAWVRQACYAAATRQLAIETATATLAHLREEIAALRQEVREKTFTGGCPPSSAMESVAPTPLAPLGDVFQDD